MYTFMMSAFWIIVMGAFIYNIFVKNSNNRKAAQSGEDKERLRMAAEQLSDGDGNCLYAHWEEQEHYGRTVKTTFHRYVLTYRDQALCVAPLYIDKKTREIQAGRPSVFTLENLGKVTVKTKRKDGAIVRMKICLIGKQGQTLLQLSVDAENLRKSRWYPVNISQQEECEAFEFFMNSLAELVAADNPGIDDLIKANDNAGLGIFGAGVSIVGAVFSIFLPPLGIALTMIGLLMSVVSKMKGAKSNVPLIISIICFICSSGFAWMFLKYFV